MMTGCDKRRQVNKLHAQKMRQQRFLQIHVVLINEKLDASDVAQIDLELCNLFSP